MVKIFSQTHRYEDAWPTVALAFFLRYPNRYASHVVSADVLSRTISPRGTLLTTRLILKRGALPAWFPSSLVARAESWIVEESEVDPTDPGGRVLNCWTRNLDHRGVMEVVEHTELREAEDGSTIHKTEARFVSGVGWGLKRRIEEYSASRFKANIEKSRLGLALVVRLLREARLQTLPFGNRMTQGSANNSNDDMPNATPGANGNGKARWSYSDIHAAAIASSSSFASSSSSSHSNSLPTSTSQSRRSSPLRGGEEEGPSRSTSRSSLSRSSASTVSDREGRESDRNAAGGWSSWLW